MKTLKESILSDVDKTLSDNDVYGKVYPIPKAKDFKRSVFGGVYIEWYCKDLIQDYIGMLDIPEFGHTPKSAISGIRIDINRDKSVYTSLISDKTHSSTGEPFYEYNKIDLSGVGDIVVANSMPKSKKAALEFFANILKQPDNLKKVFEWTMKCENDLKLHGMCDCRTWQKIIGY